MVKARAFAPLSEPNFRRIWSASLLSNFGQLVLGVAAAWQMTRLTNSPAMVALVQTALMLPLMLVAVPAGAIADMFDRRKIAMSGLAFSAFIAAVLTGLSAAGLATPWVLLVFCFLAGTGVGLYQPSWQASIPEQVSSAHLPSAIALGSISYNLARSFGPALGGVLVVAFGATVVFGVTALFYLPLILAFFAWNRRHIPPRLPPERLDRAIISGVRYTIHSSPVRKVMVRCAAYCVASASLTALIPLIARDLLHGNADTYGLLLGAVGVGAVIGGALVGVLREYVSVDRLAALCTLVFAAAVAVIGYSTQLALTLPALVLCGAAHTIHLSQLNVSMQLSVPRWVTARALAWYSSSLTGGIALGAWIWGQVASGYGVSYAMTVSAGTLLASCLLTWLMPLREIGAANLGPARVHADLDVSLALSGRSGPIVIEIDYRVDPDNARGFYDAMLKLQQARLRNGGFGWRLSRDIADAWLWIEHFEFPTWQDYLRHHDRLTEADLVLSANVRTFTDPDDPLHIRRRLERPFGSVRWKADTPDPERDMEPIVPQSRQG